MNRLNEIIREEIERYLKQTRKVFSNIWQSKFIILRKNQ